MAELVDRLVNLQANAVVMYAQAHGYHWNVKGPVFKELHAFFLEIYEDVFDSIDAYSENIRKLGSLAPFGLQSWAFNSTIRIDEDPDKGPEKMVRNLVATNEQIIAMLKETFDVADKANEQGVANFIAERIDKHQFWGWQLVATDITGFKLD